MRGRSIGHDVGLLLPLIDWHLRLLALLERADSDAATKHDDGGGEGRGRGEMRERERCEGRECG